MSVFDINMSWEETLTSLGFYWNMITHRKETCRVWRMDGRNGFFGEMFFTPWDNHLSGEVFYTIPGVYGINAESIEYNINTTDELVSIVTALKEKGRF